MFGNPAFSAQDGVDISNIVVAILGHCDNWEIICCAIRVHVLDSHLREAVLPCKETRTKGLQIAKHAPWVSTYNLCRSLDFSRGSKGSLIFKLRLLLFFFGIFLSRPKVVLLVDREHVDSSLLWSARDPLRDWVKIDALNSASIVASAQFLYHLAIASAEDSHNLTFKGGSGN